MAVMIAVFIAGLAIGGLIAFMASLKFRMERDSARADLQREREHRDSMGNAFSTMAQDALDKANERFLQLAQEKLKQAQADGAHDLDKRQRTIDELVKPIQKQLETLNGAVEQIKGTDTAVREDLKSLSRETARLVGALRDPSAQGRWGEYILDGLLEKSGLIRGIHYETQVSMQTEGGKQRPDAIIHVQDGLHIVVDAKAPLNEFTDRLVQDMSEEDLQRLMENVAAQVQTHVRALGRKNYWENVDSPDFTVLFLPSEHLFSMALRGNPALVDIAHQNNVIIASPTLMMSLLRVVALSYRQVALAKNAQDISDLGAELYKRLGKFADGIQKIGSGLTSALKGYNEAVGTLESSVLPQTRKFKDLHVQTGGKDIAELLQIEDQPRLLTRPEILEAIENPEEIRPLLKKPA